MYGVSTGCEDLGDNRWWHVALITFQRMIRGYAVAVTMILILFFSVGAWGATSPGGKLDRALELLRLDRDEGMQLLVELTNELQNEQHDVKSLIILGRTHFYLEEDVEALAAFSRAMELDPTTSDAYFFSGLIHAFGSNVTEAIQLFESATEHNPSVDAYWMELGRVYSMAGLKEKALIAYERTFEINPEHTSALYNSGVVVYELRGEAEALDRFMKVLEIDPAHADAAYNAGTISQNAGNYEQALGYFNVVVSSNPDHWGARTKVIQLYQALGEYDLRDQARDELLDLRRRGEVEDLAMATHYVRDQFDDRDKHVVVLEYFDLEGMTPMRYIFEIFDASSGKKQMQISLGSYVFTRTIAKEQGVDDADQLFHLDGYWPNGSHATYGFFIPEPTYDTVRKLVLEILDDKLSPVSSLHLPE